MISGTFFTKRTQALDPVADWRRVPLSVALTLVDARASHVGGALLAAHLARLASLGVHTRLD